MVNPHNNGVYLINGKIVSNYKEVYPMIIDFDKIELKVLENFRGGEKATTLLDLSFSAH